MSTTPDPSSDDDLNDARASARRLRPTDARHPIVDSPSHLDESASGFAPLRQSIAARRESSGREVCVACVGLPRRPAARTAAPDRAQETTPDLPFDLHSIEATGVDAWNKLLAWACVTTNAHGAFVSDRDGLLIATHGAALSPGGFELIGPHMVVALRHLPALGEPPAAAEWTALHYRAEHIVAIRFDTSLTGDVLLALLVRNEPPSRAIDRVIESIRAFVRIA